MDAPLLLIVEDDADLRRILSLQLQHIGYRVELAADGEEGFDRARELVPDLILLDLMMPGMDGFQLLKRIKCLPGLDRTPVAILTASQDEHHRRKGLSHFADAFLTKPYQIDEIKGTIDRLLAAKGPAPQG